LERRKVLSRSEELSLPEVFWITVDTQQSSRLEFTIEILEAIILALVALATAWSGFQAAQWNGHQAELYGEANGLSLEAANLVTSAGQEHLYNTNTLNAWLNAYMQGNKKVVQFYERRFLAEYKNAFDAWIKLDPFNNSDAPIGPTYMPGYRSSKMVEAGNLSSEALSKFNQGTKARAIADDYVLNTVFLATVLVLAAISQRFQIKTIRTGLIIMSSLLLLFAIMNLSMLQRF
jgi:hypothetical protein